MDPKRVALYARVSTVQHGQDVETQLIALRDFAQHRGFLIVDEYADHGWSGAKERRPQLDRMMADANKKKFDMVLVARFDRFARSVRHLLKASDEFRKLEIDFASLSEGIDTSTPAGKFLFVILAAVAELERHINQERVRLGLERARRQGKKLGRPRALVDEQKIREQVASGGSLHAIARQWGVSRGVIRRLVQNTKR